MTVSFYCQTIWKIFLATNFDLKQALDTDQIHPGTTIFAKVFGGTDGLRHKGIINNMSKKLPAYFCQLLESYLSSGIFLVIQEETCSKLSNLGVRPQLSVLGHLRFIIFIADISITSEAFVGTFVNETVTISTNRFQPRTVLK